MEGADKSYRIDRDQLEEGFPNHLLPASFWEALGRTVATFGFLEEVLGKAIFAFSATKSYADESAAEIAYERWHATLERSLFDPLGNLIDVYQKVRGDHQDAVHAESDDLIQKLRDLSVLRNVICHCSWHPSDKLGFSDPFFVKKTKSGPRVFEGSIDEAYLNQLRQATLDASCDVLDSVTSLGWQFPGTSGPGKVIWSNGS